MTSSWKEWKQQKESMSAYDPENDDPADSPNYQGVQGHRPSGIDLLPPMRKAKFRADLEIHKQKNQAAFNQETKAAALKKWKQGNHEVNKMLAKMHRQNR